MRLFIAVDMPKNMRAEIKRAQSELKRLSESGRFVPVENMHITLSFLGETSDIMGPVNAMQQAVRGIHKFELGLSEYSFFERGDSNTSFLKVSGDMNELNALHESLVSALRDEGFSGDDKRYTPHITLGRNVIHDNSVTSSMREFTASLNSSMTVSEIILFESLRTPRGMIYTPLHRERF